MEKSRKEFSLILDEKTLPIVKQLADGMPGGFFIYHADGDEKLIYINNAMLRIFGCDTEEEFKELTNCSFKGIVHPDDYEEVEKSIATQIEHSVYDLDYVEYRIIRKDGTVCWVEDYGHYLATRAYGNIFCVFIEDVTLRLQKRMAELERVNRELQNSYAKELQYRKAILHDAIFFYEVDLTRDLFLVAKVEQINGQPHELFQDMETGNLHRYSEFVELWQKKIDADILDSYRNFFDTGRLLQCYDRGELEQTFEGWVVNAYGKKYLFRYIVLLGKREPEGDLVALTIVKDITDQAEKQSLLRMALQQAETAKMARSTFLSNMSHDIRTPLNAIIGYTDLVKNHISESHRIADYVRKIRVSGEQLLDIVDESLEVTRIESGRVSLTEEECNLKDLLVSVKEAMRPEVEEKGIDFIMDFSGIIHFAVVADFIRIKEVLYQLLDNAVKYTPSGGRVRLIALEKKLDHSVYGKYQFVVEDTGIGISREFQEELFIPFKRANNTTHSGIHGTGLGLTVVKSLVDMMEGEITVESELQKGSRFLVSLLLKLQPDQKKQSETKETIDQEAFKGIRILLVEDNMINREIAEELLTAKGYVVETAENGKIALDMLKGAEPGYYGLVLMDIQMPVMDGYEATRAIRQLESKELAQIPIIALSANAFAEDYYKSIKAGTDAHFSKPIDINSLQELINQVLSSKR